MEVNDLLNSRIQWMDDRWMDICTLWASSSLIFSLATYFGD